MNPSTAVAAAALPAAYRPSELVFVQYLVGDTPLAGPHTAARWGRYDERPGRPWAYLNGGRLAGRPPEHFYRREKLVEWCREAIDPVLEQTTPVAVTGTATRAGDAIVADVTVTGVDPAAGLRLRLVLVEPVVRYVAPNGVRFHHAVARHMIGGPDGVVLGGAVRYRATVDVAAVRAGLHKYLDDRAAAALQAERERQPPWAADRLPSADPFPADERPMALTGLAVVALVQDDRTNEIVQAARFAVADAGR